MKEFVSYPSIEAFKTVNHDVKKCHGGALAKLPVIDFEGTTKVHGTNAAIVVWFDDMSYQCQSRKRVITPGKQDNAGFAAFVESMYGRQGVLQLVSGVDHKGLGVAVYGEWCGANIQSGVAVSGMEKHFVIFGCCIILGKDSGGWVRKWVSTDCLNIVDLPMTHMVRDFGVFKVRVDFNDPAPAIEKLNKLRDMVEDACPVGTTLNPNSDNKIGEGIVWTGTDDKGITYMFKHKGDKHQRSGKSREIKVAQSYTDEQIAAVNVFVAQALSEDRLMQGLEVMSLEGVELDRKNTGNYIGWVMSDIGRELRLEIAEMETVHGVSWKPLTSPILQAVRQFWFEAIDNSVMEEAV